MRRILIAVALLVCAAPLQAQPKVADLMSFGMNDFLANKLAEDGADPFRSNNVAVKMKDAAGTPVPVLKVDASDDTILDAASGDIVKIAVASTPEIEIISDTVTFTGNTGVIAAPTAVALAVGAVTEVTAGNDKLTFSGNTGVVAAATAVALAVGATSEVTVSNDDISFSGNTGVVAAPTAVALKAAGANVATVNNRGIQFTSAGQGVTMPSYVPTLAATPVAGTNDFKPNTVNVVPTHAANVAGLLPPTPIVGDQFVIKNAAGANIRVKAGGAATLNGATAGGYIVQGTGTIMHCYATAADNYDCDAPVQPTPAGP